MNDIKKRRVKPVTLEGARVLHKNFSGENSAYSDDKRIKTFSVILDDHELAGALKEEGWNVKSYPPREEDELPIYYLPVKISFTYPPTLFQMLTDDKGEIIGKLPLNEETIATLDSTPILYVDVILNGHVWDNNKRVKAYLNSLYAVTDEDELQRKWRDVPIISQ